MGDPTRESELERGLGYWVEPEASSAPAVVMVHDVWGLAEHTRALARRLAADGYGVLAIDLYRREKSVEIEDPGAWIRELSDPRVLADLQQAIDFCAAEPLTSGRRVGITGFCMGGMYTLLAAMSCQGLAAAVSYYGMLSYETGLLVSEAGLDPAKKPSSPLELAPELRCPLLAFFGEQDAFIPLEQVRRLEERLATSEQESVVKVYPEAGHAFMNDTRPDAYRPEAAEDAWERMLRFLAATLD